MQRLASKKGCAERKRFCPSKSAFFARMDSLLNSSKSESSFFPNLFHDCLESALRLPPCEAPECLPNRAASAEPAMEPCLQIRVHAHAQAKEFLDTRPTAQANFPCGEFLRVLGDNDRNRNQEPLI
jgi:hypothetical protein